MAVNRPTMVLVVGILQIVFGAMGLMCDLVGGVTLATTGGTGQFNMGGNTPQARRQVEMQQHMERVREEKEPYYKQVAFANLGVSVTLSLMMLLSGIGLVRVEAWGRSLGIGYAVLSLLTKVLTVLYAAAFTVPAMQEVARTLPRQTQEEQIMATTIGATSYIALGIPLLLAVYPAVILFLLCRPAVVEAFGEGAADARPFPDGDGWRS
jgi:hypothetical protein